MNPNTIGRLVLLFGFLIISFPSCNLRGLNESEEGSYPGNPSKSIISKNPRHTAPVLTGENISCTYFVSPKGHDSAPGSESSPWEGFQFAMDTARPGDTVCFRGGTYNVTDTVQITQSGSVESPVIFIAYPGENPILDGGGLVADLLILGQGVTYMRLSGFTLRNFSSWGLSLDGDNRDIQLDHLLIEGGEAGVHFTYGDEELGPPEAGPVEHILLEDSLIVDSEYTGVDCTPGPCSDITFRRVEVYGSGLVGESSFGADGIAISRGYPILVEDCNIHDNGGDGIDLNSRDIDGYALGVVVRRNRVVRNHQNGIKLWAGGLIENNLVWGSGNSALWLGTFNSQLEVVNNTIAYNMWDQSYSGRNWAVSVGYPEEIVSLPEVELLLVNNIFAFNTGPEIGDPTGLYLGPGVTINEHHNLYYSNEDGEITAGVLNRDFTRLELIDGTWTSFSGDATGDLIANPLFLSGWPGVDLSLQPASPGIDTADNEFCPAQDALGAPRPVDGDNDGEANCDIGAFEWSNK